MIRLGLIGDNIRRSKSPLLHRLAGQLCGLNVSYEPLIPAEMGRDFDAVFDHCAQSGFRGVNVTYPYKEQVVARLAIPDPLTRGLGACNTVIFGPGQPVGHNTDRTGFTAAFRTGFGDAAPGRVAMAGAGGVGKAIAFGLADLGAQELAIFDPDPSRARMLVAALEQHAPSLPVRSARTLEEAIAGAEGLVNATPLGMYGVEGTAFPAPLPAAARWAFDAVYTPEETRFLSDARAHGLEILSGYELVLHQGVQAFRHFTGGDVDAAALRAALRGSQPKEAAV